MNCSGGCQNGPDNMQHPWKMREEIVQVESGASLAHVCSQMATRSRRAVRGTTLLATLYNPQAHLDSGKKTNKHGSWNKEAYGIISIAQYYNGDVWTSWTVEVKVTMANFISNLACGNRISYPRANEQVGIPPAERVARSLVR